ncbi:MAG TPA: hypothetical protein VMS08_03105 [Candidatus Saccharimonadia bacterium]|nr:hypothetical protein [Candidatus Saccharimonadia bacterium]
MHVKSRRAIYILQSVNGFAGALTGVFVPAYLLHFGTSVEGMLAYMLLYSVGVFVVGQITGIVSRTRIVEVATGGIDCTATRSSCPAHMAAMGCHFDMGAGRA